MSSEAAEPSGSDVPEGGRVGRYQLCCRLARGGMGTVFLARMEGPGRFAKLLALKLIHPYLVDRPEVVEMFLEEARLASLINHPNVCSVLDFGHHEDNYFMTMEYLAGDTVQDLIRAVTKVPEIADGPTWPAIALRIVQDACEGLHAAHELRDEHGESLEVVHRDVSPSNIFVTFDGATKIVDFGIAKAADGARDKTQPGMMKGRYRYMAPEQAQGQPFDRRVDIWALGVVLWELLALRPLFERTNEAQVLWSVVHDEVPAPSSVRPDLPPELDAIVHEALAKDPEERYGSAREMGRDLNRVMMLLPAPAGPAELAEVMAEVFPDRHRERFQLMEHVRQLDSGVVLTLPDGGSDGFDGRPTALTAVPISQVRPSPASPGKRSTRSLALVVSVIAGVLGAVGGVAAVLHYLPGDDSAEGSAIATASAPTGVAETDREVPEVEGVEPEGDEADLHTVAVDEVVVIAGAEGVVADGETTAEGGESADDEDEGTGLAENAEDGDPADDEAETDDGDPDELAEGSADDEEGAGADESAQTSAAERARRRRIRRARAAAGPPGTVNIVTPGGWADIYVRGRPYGRSPASIELPPGRHVIVLRPFGGSDSERQAVRVRSGDRARVSVRLQR